MLKYAVSALLALAVHAKPSAEVRASVQAFDDLATKYNFDYEVHKVTTTDSWELTMFRILGDETKKVEGQNPLFFMHGGGLDASVWMQTFAYGPNGDVPMMVQLANAGHDVWMGNQRATKYSNVNTLYPDADDMDAANYQKDYDAKYDYSYEEEGTLDLPAFIDGVIEVTKAPKVVYLGYSKGTGQILYALTQMEESYFVNTVERVILMAPCYALNSQGGIDRFATYFDTLDSLGIKLLGGANWDDVHYPAICGASDSVCQELAGYGAYEPLTVKSSHIWTANALTNKFARYMPEFSKGIPAEADIPLVTPGLESIEKIPIQLLPSVGDTSCLIAQNAEVMKEQIPALISYNEVYPDGGHQSFSMESTEEFMNILKEQITLTIPERFNEVNDGAAFISASALSVLAAVALLN